MSVDSVGPSPESRIVFNEQIVHRGQTYFRRFAKTPDDFLEAKKLDDIVFQSQVGVTLEEMYEVAENGAIILLEDSSGRLVGESQVITSPVSSYPNLESDEAFYYGTAIHPDLQNQGLAQLLFEAQTMVAVSAGKSRSTLTARVENASSIRGRFKDGYHIVAYDPTRYGTIEENGARLIMEKRHTEPRRIWQTAELAGRLLAGKVAKVENIAMIDGADKLQDEFVGVPVHVGEEVDYDAHTAVSLLLSERSFTGIGLLRPTEFTSRDSRSVLVFQKTR